MLCLGGRQRLFHLPENLRLTDHQGPQPRSDAEEVRRGIRFGIGVHAALKLRWELEGGVVIRRADWRIHRSVRRRHARIHSGGPVPERCANEALDAREGRSKVVRRDVELDAITRREDDGLPDSGIRRKPAQRPAQSLVREGQAPADACARVSMVKSDQANHRVPRRQAVFSMLPVSHFHASHLS